MSPCVVMPYPPLSAPVGDLHAAHAHESGDLDAVRENVAPLRSASHPTIAMMPRLRHRSGRPGVDVGGALARIHRFIQVDVGQRKGVIAGPECGRTASGWAGGQDEDRGASSGLMRWAGRESTPQLMPYPALRFRSVSRSGVQATSMLPTVLAHGSPSSSNFVQRRRRPSTVYLAKPVIVLEGLIWKTSPSVGTRVQKWASRRCLEEGALLDDDDVSPSELRVQMVCDAASHDPPNAA